MGKLSQRSRLLEIRRDVAPIYRKILAMRGCRLPFYDGIDFWQDAFHDMVRDAKLRFPSLLNVHEVTDKQFIDEDWRPFGYGALRCINFNEDKPDAKYGKYTREQLERMNLAGFATAFLDGKGRLRTAIMLRNKVTVGTRQLHGEDAYRFKLATLAHELGHVDDFECKITTDCNAKTIRLLDAEVYAELFSIAELQRRNLQASLRIVLQALRERSSHDDLSGEVARRVEAEMKIEPTVDHKALLLQDITDRERIAIGEKAFAILVEYDRLIRES